MTQNTTRQPSLLGWGAMLTAAVIGVVILLSLGVWQVERLRWKTDLIARVDARVAAAPVAAPGPQDWPAITTNADEYRRVTITGHYDFAAERLVMAVTERGPGFWVMTPLITANGWALWINRGFVPDANAPRLAPAADQTVTGLLRMTQPDGGFLRPNSPATGRWYSRDVAALTSDAGLAQTAPYFIDAAADSTADADRLPVPGLTVIAFRNAHLSYALTWFAMAAGLAFGAWYGLIHQRGRDARV